MIRVADMSEIKNSRDSHFAARLELQDDVNRIVEENIPFCEIEVGQYKSSYAREAIKMAIRRAIWKYNEIWETDGVDKHITSSSFHVIHSDGKWYVHFKGCGKA